METRGRHAADREFDLGLGVATSMVLQFKSFGRAEPRRPFSDGAECEIVIFPGIRIERHETADIDLAHRVGKAGDDFDGLGGGRRRPRKSS